MKTFIKTTFHDSLKPLFIGLGVVYLVLGASHVLFLPEEFKWLMFYTAIASSAILVLTGMLYQKSSTLREYTMAMVAIIIVGIPIVNTIVHIALVTEVKQTTNLIIILLAGCVIILDTAWFLVIALSGIVLWVKFMHPYIDTGDSIHFSLALAMAFAVSLGIHFNRKKLLQNMVTAQRDGDVKNKELLSTQGDLKETIIELEQTKELAEQAAQAKEQFLSNMSHELRTPLNAVIGLAQLLQNNSPRPDQIDDLETLTYSARNLLSLINEILDLNKINGGNMEVEHIPFNLSHHINSLVKSHKVLADQKGISIELNISDKLPKQLLGDPLRLEQVLNNLMSNAIKFTPKGSVKVDLDSHHNKDGSCQLHFSVTDTGIGMNQEQLQHIFDPFRQADSATTRKYGGTGLGLSITKELVTLLGGELKVESEPAVGSKFSFELTLDVPEKTVNTSTHENAFLDNSPVTAHILMVDDNIINLKVLGKMLKQWGVTTESASNGAEAVEMAKGKQFDMILMDLQMPILDGYSATKTIRSLNDNYFKCLPILALTAATMDEVKVRIEDSGMDGYLFKPFKQQDLKQEIKKYLVNSVRNAA